MPRSIFAYRTLVPSTGRVLTSRCRFSTSPKLRHVEEQSNFLESFIQGFKPSKSTLDYFSSVGWTRQTLEDEAYEIVPFFSRYFNERTGENRFFARTVNTETTIPHVLSFRLKDFRTPEPVPRSSDQSTTLDPVDLTTPSEVICLMSLGQELEAHPSIVHGGFQCVIFDEIMRLLILLHQNNISKPGPRDNHFTLSMKISYAAPVIAPSNVLVRAELIKRVDRKWFTKAEIVDCAGKILTSAESMWLTAKNPVAR